VDGASASGVHVKPPLRTKSVGTKVSEAEFALLEERARGAGMRLAEWVREALLAAPVEPVAGSGVDSRVQNTSYDQAKRLTALFDNFNSVNVDLASNFGYYPNGAVEDVYLGNSNSSQTHQHTTLNSRLQVTGRSAQVHSTDGSPTLLTLGFNYPSSPSNNGNISSESITTNGGMGSSGINVTQSFGYDAFNRILSMSETSGLSQSYGYDAYGNRALTGGYAPSPYLTPTSTSQFTGNRWLGSGSSTAGYDASGNQTQNTNGGNVFTFDAENRMVTSNIGNMGVTSYVYDGEGRRIEKTSSTFTSYYVYDFSGATVAEYTTETQPVYGTLYVTPDHLGSTRLLTNGNGDVVRRYDYLPFGEEIPSGSYSRGNDYGGNQYPNAGGTSFPGDAASHKFTGKERDWETGLDFFGLGTSVGRREGLRVQIGRKAHSLFRMRTPTTRRL
jgi:YD repeat-containing protein